MHNDERCPYFLMAYNENAFKESHCYTSFCSNFLFNSCNSLSMESCKSVCSHSFAASSSISLESPVYIGDQTLKDMEMNTKGSLSLFSEE